MATKQNDPDPSSRKSRRRFFAFYELPVAAARTTNTVEQTDAGNRAAGRKQRPTWKRAVPVGIELGESLLSEF